MATLMLGALAMHLKIGDAVQKSAPAATVLALALLVAIT